MILSSVKIPFEKAIHRIRSNKMNESKLRINFSMRYLTDTKFIILPGTYRAFDENEITPNV